MIHFLRVPAALCAGLIAFAPWAEVVAQNWLPEDPIPPDSSVVAGRLDNGLRYFVQENDQPENRAELRLVVDVGSIMEDEDQLGLAHFVEHMAFNGTENFEKQELVDYLESIGMQFGPDVNAYTSFDETVYMLQVPMDDPEVLATAFQILRDWAGGVLFEAEEVDKERGVVIEEWRLRRGAASRMQDKQLPIMLHGSLYAERLPIGEPEIIENAPVETLRRFYDDWYRPDLMGVVAVGDFDGAGIEAMIHDTFGGLTGPDDPRPRTFADVPVDHAPLVAIATDEEAQMSQAGVLYKQPRAPQGTVADFRRALVQSLYSGMLNARLQELTQQAAPPFLFAFSGQGGFVRGVDAYQLVAIVPEGGLTTGLNALLTEAERVVRHGFTATEFERQKTDLRRGYERQLAERENQESGALASGYVQVFLRGLPYPDIETEVELVDALLSGITLEETNAFAGQWLNEQGRVVLASGPEKEGLETPGDEDLTALFEAVAAAEIEPYDDAVVDAPLLPVIPEGSAVMDEETVDEVGITIWTLENSVRVFLKPTDFKDDEVRFSATSPGGSSLGSDEHFVSTNRAATLVARAGVGEFDDTALEKKLSGKIVGVSPGLGSLSEGVSGFASPEDLETAFQLVYLYFSAPRKDETAFEAYKALMAGILANREANPNVAFSDTIRATMTQGHPRASRPMTQELLEEIDLDRAFSFYQERFADASDFTFYFVGAFDPEEIRPMVEQYLGALPNLGREETWRDLGVDPPSGVIEKTVHKGIEPQSRTQIIFAGEGAYSPEESTVIGALASILEIRLRELLREDLGGTYGVGVGSSLTYRPDEEYDVTISFGSDPERADELAAVVFEEIERIKTDGPDAETVDKVRESQRRAKETNLRENSYWLGRIQGMDQEGRDLRLIPSYDLIEGWTAEQVQEAAVRYLREDQYAKFVLYPEETVEADQ
ncbi:MAG: insulinase family protein [Bacteroidetes bacterium SB0662_bin_6]|nr:insulinase family protein [Bacteroidetes bacterium SB0668_bin_1]MYE04571.1 insulinase family protein [Bacteroidetes bacterium SB0662_bin_6]